MNAFELPDDYGRYGELSTSAARERRRWARCPRPAIFDHSIAPRFAAAADAAITSAEETLRLALLPVPTERPR